MYTKKSTPTFPSLRCVDLARDILHPPLKPPSSSLQPPHLINADSQLTQARITNLFHFSLHTTNDPSVLRYLSLSPLSKDTSEFISKPGAGANAAALMRRKMNIVVVLFIVLKGTATHQELSRRLYLEVNSPMWTYCQPVWSFFFMSLICQTLCTNPCILSLDSLSQKVRHGGLEGANHKSELQV